MGPSSRVAARPKVALGENDRDRTHAPRTPRVRGGTTAGSTTFRVDGGPQLARLRLGGRRPALRLDVPPRQHNSAATTASVCVLSDDSAGRVQVDGDATVIDHAMDHLVEYYRWRRVSTPIGPSTGDDGAPGQGYHLGRDRPLELIATGGFVGHRPIGGVTRAVGRPLPHETPTRLAERTGTFRRNQPRSEGDGPSCVDSDVTRVRHLRRGPAVPGSAPPTAGPSRRAKRQSPARGRSRR